MKKDRTGIEGIILENFFLEGSLNRKKQCVVSPTLAAPREQVRNWTQEVILGTLPYIIIIIGRRKADVFCGEDTLCCFMPVSNP